MTVIKTIFLCLNAACLLYSYASSNVPYVIFGGLFETWDYVKSTNSYVFNSTGAQYQAGFLMAIDEINNKTDGLSDHLLPDTYIYNSVSFSQESSFYYTSIGAALLGTSNIVIGPNGETAAATSSGILEASDVLQIGFSSMSSLLGSKTNYPYFIRTCSDEALEGFLIAYTVAYFGWSRIIVFTTNDDYGTYMLSALELGAENKGIEILVTYSVFPGHSDFSTSIIKAKGKAAYIFVILMESETASTLLEQGYNLGLFHEGTQILGSAKVASASTWQSMSKSADVPKIMNGLLAPVPTFSYQSSTRSKNFIKRWRKQKPTVTTLSDGSKICHDDTDYYGNYLYKSTWAPSVCTGLEFTSFAIDDSDIDPYVAFAYDATYAAAIAFHWMIYYQNKSSFSADELLAAFLYNITFTGITGEIAISSGTSGDKLGQGDRIYGLYFNIVNFNPSLYKSRNSSLGYQTVLSTVLTEDPTLECIACDSIIYNTEDNTKPLDRPAETLIDLSFSLKVLLLTWAIILSLLLFGFTFMVIWYRKNRIIRASQPVMLYLILFGGLLGVAKIFISSIHILNDFSCKLSVWVTHLAFGYVFSALIVKTWIINKIINSKLKKVKISITDAVINVAIAMIILKVVMFLITFIGDPHLATTLTDDVTNPERSFYYCNNADSSISTILLVLEALSLLIAIRLGWAIRNVPDALNESKYIIAAVAVVILVGVVDGIIKQYAGYNVIAKAFAIDLGIAMTLNLVILILFAPKAYLLWIGAEFDGQLRLIRPNVIPDIVTEFKPNDLGAPPSAQRFEDVCDDDDEEGLPLGVQASAAILKKGTKDSNKKLATENLNKIQIVIKKTEEKLSRHKLLLDEWDTAVSAIEKNKLGDIIDMKLSTVAYYNPNAHHNKNSLVSGRSSSVD